MPKGRVYKTKSKGAQEAHESIRPTSFRRDPDSLARFLKPEELRLYRLIWQRALASQMEAKELETTTAELAAGPYELRASATRVLFDGFARVYTEGRDEARRRGPPRRRRRARRPTRTPRAGCPALARGRRDRRPRHHDDPALHRAAAALHRGVADQGARGARDRPPVDVRRDDLDDRRSRLRPRRGAAAPPGAGRGHRDRPARRALRRLRRRRVHGADGGGARRGRERQARLGAAARGVLPAAPRPRRRGPQGRPAARDFTTEETDEVCSEGHPMVIRLGRNGRFLACSMYPEHKEIAAAAGRRAAAPGRGPGRPARSAGSGTLVGEARAVRAVRRLRPLPGLRLHQARGPGAPAAPRRSRSSARRTRTASSSRVARGGPATSSGGARTTRSATTRRTTSRSARSTTPTTGPVGEAKADGYLCLKCGADDRGAGGRGRRRSARLPGGPPNPAALAPARRGGGRPRWRAATGRTTGRAAGRHGGAAAAQHADVVPDVIPHPARGRSLRRGHAGRGRRATALDRFLLSLRAKDASEHTLRSYATVGRRLPRLARGARRRLARAGPRRPAGLPRPARRRRVRGPR